MRCLSCPVLSCRAELTRRPDSHRWDRAVKAWVPMDEPARTAARDEVRERKRLDLARQGRLSAAGP